MDGMLARMRHKPEEIVGKLRPGDLSAWQQSASHCSLARDAVETRIKGLVGFRTTCGRFQGAPGAGWI